MYTEGFGCTPIMLICLIYGPPVSRNHLPKQFNKCKYQGRVVNVELICNVPTLLLSNVMGYKSWQLCCLLFITFILLLKSALYPHKLLYSVLPVKPSLVMTSRVTKGRNIRVTVLMSTSGKEMTSLVIDTIRCHFPLGLTVYVNLSCDILWTSPYMRFHYLK